MKRSPATSVSDAPAARVTLMQSPPDPRWGPPQPLTPALRETSPDPAWGAPAHPPAGIPPRARSQRGWWVALGVAGLVVALVAALGGFRTADIGNARRVAPGTAVRLTNWTITVLEAEVVDDSSGREIPTEVRVRLDIVNHHDATKDLPDDLIMVQLPEGDRQSFPRLKNVDPRKAEQYDPQVTEPVWRISTYKPGVRPRVSGTLTVLISDERWNDGLLDDKWVVAGVVARVEVPLVDRRLHA